MKKLLMLTVAFMLVAGIASASTVTLLCTVVGGTIGSNSFASGAINCPDWNPAGYTGYFLDSVQVNGNDSFAGGLGTGTFTFSYTGINPDFLVPASGTNGCSGSGGSNSCSDAVTGFVGAVSAYIFGPTDGTPADLSNYSGTGTWTFASVSGTLTSGSGLGTGGVIVTQASVTYDYFPTQTTPEPMSMLLVGGGLLGLGLAASKLRKKA